MIRPVDGHHDVLERHQRTSCVSGMMGIASASSWGAVWKNRCAIAVGITAERITTPISSENWVRVMMPALRP